MQQQAYLLRYLPGMGLSDIRAMTMRELVAWVEVTSEMVRKENEGDGEGE